MVKNIIIIIILTAILTSIFTKRFREEKAMLELELARCDMIIEALRFEVNRKDEPCIKEQSDL